VSIPCGHRSPWYACTYPSAFHRTSRARGSRLCPAHAWGVLPPSLPMTGPQVTMHCYAPATFRDFHFQEDVPGTALCLLETPSVTGPQVTMHCYAPGTFQSFSFSETLSPYILQTNFSSALPKLSRNRDFTRDLTIF
jgi:hypothetical protein